MPKTNWNFSQRAVVTAISLVLGGSAQAIVVRGSMDPPFGPSLPNLGWSGFGDFFLDNACLGVPSGTFLFFDTTCGGAVSSGSAMGWLGGSVNLWDVRSTPPAPGPTLQTIGFPTTNSLPPGQNSLLMGIFVDFDSLLGRNTIAGVDTFFIPGTPDADLTPPGDIYDGPLWLFFVSGQQPCGVFIPCGSGSGPIGSGSFGPFAKFDADPAFLATCPSANCLSDPAMVRFAEISIPEPGTLGLVLGALGGGWLARRRRNKAETN